MDRSKSLPAHLRAAAAAERDTLVQWTLNKAADDLDQACAALAGSPTVDNLIAVNGLWSRGYRMLGPDGVTNGLNASTSTGSKEGTTHV